MTKTCVICRTANVKYGSDNAGWIHTYDCPVCGKYQCYEQFCREMHDNAFKFPIESIAHLWSGAVREQNELNNIPQIKSVAQLQTLVRGGDDFFNSIDRVLRYVYYHAESASKYVSLDLNTDYPIAYCKDADEFHYILDKAVILGLLEDDSTLGHNYRLDVEGIKRVRDLTQLGSESHQVFVAMWFDESTEKAYAQSIVGVLDSMGYSPLRIDKSEHNERIDDKIIAEIRRSKFLVADFTGNRGGVYFEAGFALGLGLPVIWCCHESHKSNLHFDTRQYNHIMWTDPSDLSEKLRNRILATIPGSSEIQK